MGSASDLTKDVLVTPATRSTTAAAGTIVKDTVTNTNSARALFTDNNKTKQALEQELPYETPESRFLPRTRPKRSSASSDDNTNWAQPNALGTEIKRQIAPVAEPITEHNMTPSQSDSVAMETHHTSAYSATDDSNDSFASAQEQPMAVSASRYYTSGLDTGTSLAHTDSERDIEDAAMLLLNASHIQKSESTENGGRGGAKTPVNGNGATPSQQTINQEPEQTQASAGTQVNQATQPAQKRGHKPVHIRQRVSLSKRSISSMAPAYSPYAAAHANRQTTTSPGAGAQATPTAPDNGQFVGVPRDGKGDGVHTHSLNTTPQHQPQQQQQQQRQQQQQQQQQHQQPGSVQQTQVAPPAPTQSDTQPHTQASSSPLTTANASGDPAATQPPNTPLSGTAKAQAETIQTQPRTYGLHPHVLAQAFAQKPYAHKHMRAPVPGMLAMGAPPPHTQAASAAAAKAKGVASLAAGANGSQILSAGAGLRTGAGMSQSATDTTSSPSSSKIPARTNPNSFGTGRPVSPIGGESGPPTVPPPQAMYALPVQGAHPHMGPAPPAGMPRSQPRPGMRPVLHPRQIPGAPGQRGPLHYQYGAPPPNTGPYYAAAPPLGTAPRTIVPTPTHSTVTTETANNNNNNNNGIISAMSAINPTTVSDTAHPDDENGGEKITGVVPSHVTSTSVAPDTEATQTEAESAVQAQSDSQIQENTQKQTQTNTHTHTQTAGNGQALTASPLSQQQHHQQQQQQQQQQLQGVPGYIPAPPPHTQSQQQQQHAHLQQQYPPNHPYARPGLQQPLQGYPPRGQMMVRGPPFMGQHLQPHPHQTGHPDHMIALHPQHQDQRPHMRPMPGTAGMPRPGMVAGGPGMGTPVKPEGRLNKGLRHFSAKVCEKLKIKGTTTYQVVSDELVNEMKAEYEADGNNCRRKPFDHKNIRRRVYDALNILQALHIIDRQRKLLVWQGFPQDSKVTVKKLIEDKAMRAHQLAEKKAALDEKILQKVMLSQVFEHNKQREAEEKSSDGFEPKLPKATLKSLGGDEEGKDQKLPPQLGIPFVLMQSPIGHNVEVTSNEDLTFYRFKYRGLRFGLEDEVSTLQKMGYGEGLVTNTCTPEALQRLKQYVPESVQPYLEERCSAKMFLKAPEDLPQPPPPNAPVLGGPGPSAPASVQSSPIPKQENGVSSTQAFS